MLFNVNAELVEHPYKKFLEIAIGIELADCVDPIHCELGSAGIKFKQSVVAVLEHFCDLFPFFFRVQDKSAELFGIEVFNEGISLGS